MQVEIKIAPEYSAFVLFPPPLVRTSNMVDDAEGSRVSPTVNAAFLYEINPCLFACDELSVNGRPSIAMVFALAVTGKVKLH